MYDAAGGEKEAVNSARKVGMASKSKGSMTVCGLVAALLRDRREDVDQAYRGEQSADRCVVCLRSMRTTLIANQRAGGYRHTYHRKRFWVENKE